MLLASGYQDTVLLTMKYFYFVFICTDTQSSVFIFLFVVLIFFVFFMNSEWNESCTESISCIQVNSSIIEDQSGVSVFFAATASTWAPSSGWLWKGLPCSEAFSGCYPSPGWWLNVLLKKQTKTKIWREHLNSF